MKLALCFSGQARTFKRCFENLRKNILSKYECDIFIHTWLYDGYNPGVPGYWCKEYKPEQYDLGLKEDRIINGDIFKMYQPKKIIIESPDRNFFEKQIKNNGFDQGFFNSLMMYYGIYKSNELKKEYEQERGFKYDCVLRCRFDTQFEQFHIMKKHLKNNTIILPPNENVGQTFYDSMKISLRKEGISFMNNDQFAYGSSEAMDFYSKSYNEYFDETKNYPNHPEGLLSHHLFRENKNYSVIVNPKIKIFIERSYD